MSRALVTLVVLAALLAAASPALAGGGINPSTEPTASSGVPFTATILFDVHMDGITSTAKQASIQLRRTIKKDTKVSDASFLALPSFTVYAGCVVGEADPNERNLGSDVNATRFLFTPANPATLYGWVPAAVLEYLFRPHGVTPERLVNDPAITQILDAKCVADPRNPGVSETTPPPKTPPPDGNLPNGGDNIASVAGVLLMEVVIELQVPAAP